MAGMFRSPIQVSVTQVAHPAEIEIRPFGVGGGALLLGPAVVQPGKEGRDYPAGQYRGFHGL